MEGNPEEPVSLAASDRFHFQNLKKGRRLAYKLGRPDEFWAN